MKPVDFFSKRFDYTVGYASDDGDTVLKWAWGPGKPIKKFSQKLDIFDKQDFIYGLIKKGYTNFLFTTPLGENPTYRTIWFWGYPNEREKSGRSKIRRNK